MKAYVLFADYRQTQQFAMAAPLFVPLLHEGPMQLAVLSAECLHCTAGLFPQQTGHYLISGYSLTPISKSLLAQAGLEIKPQQGVLAISCIQNAHKFALSGPSAALRM